MLVQYGVPVVGERLAQSADAAVDAAAALGYPVVLKVESPDLPRTEPAAFTSQLDKMAVLLRPHKAVVANKATVLHAAA